MLYTFETFYIHFFFSNKHCKNLHSTITFATLSFFAGHSSTRYMVCRTAYMRKLNVVYDLKRTETNLDTFKEYFTRVADREPIPLSVVYCAFLWEIENLVPCEIRRWQSQSFHLTFFVKQTAECCDMGLKTAQRWVVTFYPFVPESNILKMAPSAGSIKIIDSRLSVSATKLELLSNRCGFPFFPVLLSVYISVW